MNPVRAFETLLTKFIIYRQFILSEYSLLMRKEL